MRILLLGGTIFLGPHLVDAALARGHAVTIFHRGRHAWDAPHGVERAVGDRMKRDDLAALAARGPWDVVIDTCGYFPRQVRETCAALRGRAESYVFISSLSVYADTFGGGGEDAPLAAPVADDVEQVTGETYGPLKAACEAAARDAFGDRAMNVRPGLIVGPRDPSDRYTYWVRRLGLPGPVLAPGDGSRLVQFVDARDLAAFCVGLVERGRGGAWNVTGRPIRFDEFLAGIAAAHAARRDRGIVARPEEPSGREPAAHVAVPHREVAASRDGPSGCEPAARVASSGGPPVVGVDGAEFAGAPSAIRWVPEDTLAARGAGPWMEVPLWIGPQDQTTDIARALADGLRLRDPVETARATLDWDALRDAAAPMRAGMTPERERALLGD